MKNKWINQSLANANSATQANSANNATKANRANNANIANCANKANNDAFRLFFCFLGDFFYQTAASAFNINVENVTFWVTCVMNYWLKIILVLGSWFSLLERRVNMTVSDLLTE